MFVFQVARDDMPMQVRGEIAQAGKIDLVRIHCLAYRCFDSKYSRHQVCSLGDGQVGHFLDMLPPDHPAETGIIGIFNHDHPAVCILPEQDTASLIT